MKLKKILAVTIGATLALSAAVALTACGDDAPTGLPSLGTTQNINIDNYVQNIDDLDISTGKTALTTATKINSDGEKVNRWTGNYLRITVKNDSSITYKVYSAEFEKVIASGYDDIGYSQVQYYDDIIGHYVYINIIRGKSADSQYTFIAPDGTVLDTSEYPAYPNINVAYKYIGNAQTPTQVLAVRRSSTDNYFRMSEDSAGRITYSKLDSANVYDNCMADYNVGEYIGKDYTPVYESTAEQPVNGDIANYSYIEYDTKYDFYKNNELTGTVSLEYGNVLGFLGNYMYYEINVPVSPDATSGYNYVQQRNNVIQKYDYTLYRYDVVANTVTELNYDFKCIDEFLPYYNYETKAYDGAAIAGYKSHNGVFAEPNNENELTMYFTDAELNVGIEFTGKAGQPVYKLADNRYLAKSTISSGMIIVDKNLDYVTDVSDIKNDNLITFQADAFYGLKDYDGKIVVAPVYKNIGTFYGDYAAATKSTVTGDKRVFLSKTGTEKAVPESSETDDKRVTVSFPSNGLYSVTTTDLTNYTTKVEVFNYAGTVIKSFDTSVSTTIVGNKTFIIDDNNDWYLVK